MTLRRDDQCVRCHAHTPAGAPAYWDAERRHVLCLSCYNAETAPTIVPRFDFTPTATRPPAAAPLPPPRPIEVGVAGGSARREADRRTKYATGDPLAANWTKGADGECRVGAWLDALIPGSVVLHDRVEPGRRRNIDHLLIAPSGIWVIDAKNWTGRVERRDTGIGLRRDDRLVVNGRDQTRAVRAMEWQVQVVRAAIEPMGFGTSPVRPVLCFTGARWGLFARAFTIDGVLVGRPDWIEKRIATATSTFSADAIHALSTELSARLRPAIPTAWGWSASVRPDTPPNPALEPTDHSSSPSTRR